MRVEYCPLVWVILWLFGSTKLFIDVNGNILQITGEAQFSVFRDNIFLGTVYFSGTTIVSVTNSPAVVKQTATDTYDSMLYSLHLKGSGARPVTGALQIWIDEGSFFYPGINWVVDRKNPNIALLDVIGDVNTPAPLQPATQTALLTGEVLDIPQQYNPTGDTLTALNNKKATIHRIFNFGTGVARQIILLYGQVEYADAKIAKDNLLVDNDNLVLPPELVGSKQLGQVCVSGNSSDFSDPNKAWITSADIGAESTSAPRAAIDVSFAPAGTIVGTNVQVAVEEVSQDHTDHLAILIAAHAATAISFQPTPGIVAINVQAAINELEGDVLSHIGQAVDAHDASAISVTPIPDLIATEVQAALEEQFLAVLDRVVWKGKWFSTNYLKFEMVRDGDWTMIANKDTATRAAPQPVGSPLFTLPEPPPWEANPFEEETSVVSCIHEFTMLKSGWLKELKVWSPEASNTPDYDSRIYLYDVTDPANPLVLNQINSPVLLENTWSTIITANALVIAGTVLQVVFTQSHTAEGVNISGGWALESFNSGNAPGTGNWNSNNNVTGNADLLRIAKTDLDGTDRGGELAGIVSDSTIRFVQTNDTTRSADFTVATPLSIVDQGTFYAITVNTGTSEGSGGRPNDGAVTTMDTFVPVAVPTKYVADNDYWLTNQVDFANIAASLEFNGVPQVGLGLAQTAYGIDVQFQEGALSPDWEVVATSEGTSGGGSGSTGGRASDVSFVPVGDIIAEDVQAALEELDTEKLPIGGKAVDSDLLDGIDSTGFSLVAHVHNAVEVVNTPAGNISATEVQGALNELDTDLTTHANSVTAHAGASIINTPAGNITATDVQAALNELDAEIIALEGATHTHSNKAVLDAVTASFLTADETKLDGIEALANNYSHPIGDGNLHVPVNGTGNDGSVLTATAVAGVYAWQVPIVYDDSDVLKDTDTLSPVTGINKLVTQDDVSAGSGDMTKAVYDIGDSGVVDDSEKLNGQAASFYLAATAKAADSELLDGIDSTGFLLAGGKAVDSDKLDALDSSQFLRSDAADTMTEKLLLHKDIGSTATYSGGQLEIQCSDGGDASMGFHRGGYTACQLRHSSSGLILSSTSRTGAADFYAYGNVTAYSDLRLKKDLQPIPDALDKISKVTGYTYLRTNASEGEEHIRQVGVVAQELLKVLPEAVLGGPTEDDPDGHYSVAYGNIVGLLIEGIKEQQAHITSLEKRLDLIEKKSQ